MRRFVSAALSALCLSTTAYGQSSVEITLKQGSKREAQTTESNCRDCWEVTTSPNGSSQSP